MNKTAVVPVAIALVLGVLVLDALPKTNCYGPGPRIRAMRVRTYDAPADRDPLRAPAASDTTWLGVYDFDGPSNCSPDGWTSVDITAQLATWTHVDDFGGLGGGRWGLLTALEGDQSMWCGVRPDYSNPVLCGYATLPGYGDNWDQGLRTVDCLEVSGDVTVDYLLAWNSEPTFDITYLEYDMCDDQWTALAAFDGGGLGFYSHTVPGNLHEGSIRIRFRFESDIAWSDEDGGFNSDGAFIVDSLTVRDAGGEVLSTELFETESVGDRTTVSGNWEAFAGEGYGDFAGLFLGLHVLNEDICYFGATCLWGFFNGSTYDYSCDGHPEQAVVPYGNERGQYINNEIWSPVIPWTGSGNVAGFDLKIYADGGLDPLVLAVWRVRSFIGDCPLPWQWDGNWRYAPVDRIWVSVQQEFGGMVAPGATAIQIAIGVQDLCPLFCGILGSGECHSHWPLIDDIRIYRVSNTGPQWIDWMDNLAYRFQDNFAADGTVAGPARADMAADISQSGLTIVPGDSAVVIVGDPEAGLATDPYTGSGSAVYAYVSVSPSGQPGKDGPALTDDPVRWPVVDSLVHAGETWYVVRMDTVFTGTGRQNPVPNRFCVDLNDNLFTPGDTVRFAFGATSAPPSNASSYLGLGVHEHLAQVLDDADEFTILPAGGWRRGGDVLWVDGTQRNSPHSFMLESALEILGIEDQVDRYHIRAPRDYAGNRPGARVVDVSQQLAAVYRKIVWCTGENYRATIGDGINDKSDDATMLYEFLELLPERGGVYFNGDRIASEWSTLFGAGAGMLRNYLGYSLVDVDHIEYGLGFSPFGVGEPGSPFEDAGGPDTLVVYAGCPYPHGYNVIYPAGTATLAASYAGSGRSGGAIVAQNTVNSVGTSVGAMISGFSFAWIRDHGALGYPARAEHLHRILAWLGSDVGGPVGAGFAEYEDALSQNFPNPFNPTTTITYTLRRETAVTLRVYNVAGQLVRTLVDGVRAPGIAHSTEWDGRDDAGQGVSSGVYFYRLVVGDYVQTRKMVLLK